MNSKYINLLLAGVGALVITACSSLPETIPSLQNAQTLVSNVNSDPMAEQVAGSELRQAKEALARAEKEKADNGELTKIEYEAYLASRHAEIAQQRIAESRATEAIESSEEQRQEVMIQARTRDAEMAMADAADANARADALGAEADALTAELEDLQAKKTPRGMVLTLDSVLFDTDKAQLKAGASATMSRVANFMREYPDRKLLIEGYTDSRGPESYNQALSERRAQAVKTALVNQGIAGDRVQTRGLGESYPIASNDTAAGQQQNRRVEIVFSDDSGSFPAAAKRTVGGG